MVAAKRSRAARSVASGAMTGSDRIDDQEFASAFRHHQAGRLGEADAVYRAILARNPFHSGSLHYLGVIALQLGRHGQAVELIERAIALDARNPEQHYHIGLALGALDRLQEVALHARRAIDLKPDYVPAYSNLGNALTGQGKLDEAAAAYGRALSLDPSSAESRFNLANVLAKQGKLSEAADSYRRALKLKPDYAEARNNLGTTLVEQGNSDGAIAQFEATIASNPKLLPAYVNLSNALVENGRLDDAADCCNRALAHEPSFAEARHNLGLISLAKGRIDEAAAHFRRAIVLKPNLAEAYNNLADAHLARGEMGEALALLDQALRLGEADKTKALFVQCIKGRKARVADAHLRERVIRALTEAWGQPVDMALFAASLITQDRAIGECVAHCAAAWPRRLSAEELYPSGIGTIADDRLLRILMESVQNVDIDLERFLTDARRALLDAALNSSGEPEAPVLGYFCALARQAFINEYIFDHIEDEIGRAMLLRDRLAACLNSGDAVPATWLVAAAAYFPLGTISEAHKLLERAWPEPVTALLLQQLREPLEERRVRASIPALTAIEDRISLEVKQQYEENPYPRWLKLAPPGKRLTLDRKLRLQFPLASFRNLAKSGIDILIAGCGTGQHAIETAQAYVGARVLAIDLSLASLAYAKRKSAERGVDNIEYAQADILRLSTLPRSFDLIEAGGVLHHLADPLAGWRVLLSLLRPGGLMRIGLYSELGRRDVASARAFIAERGYPATAEGIRKSRQELLASAEAASLKSVCQSSDFFNTSTCRDLLFHVQEHRFTLPEISRFLAESQLSFIGFALDPPTKRLYAEQFPDDRMMADLAQWDAFEQEHPETFAGMYNFWVQKN
jgi:tetratricopeptide (TPR) repeat protein/SAM-dependent methyltransferase